MGGFFCSEFVLCMEIAFGEVCGMSLTLNPSPGGEGLKKKISLCLTNYNRDEMLVESFRRVLEHSLIDEVVIVDDCSTEAIYERMQGLLMELPCRDKIKLYRNEKNIGMSLNKCEAVRRASNEWCILFDSDNVMEPRYLNAVAGRFELNDLSPATIYCPDFAEPRFDYREFACKLITLKNALEFSSKKMFDCLMNTCNYMVHRNSYLQVYKHNDAMVASDTIWFNYLWLKSGRMMYVVPGMSYTHRVHDGSGFLEDAKYNMQQAEKVMEMIKGLSRAESN